MTTPTQTHPSLEELAAFLDGKLEGEERARVIQHLDECPDCYETFAGTARFLQEEENLGKQTQGGRVVPFPLGGGDGSDKKPWRWWLPLAAGVILVAGLAGTGYVSFFAPPRMKVAELVKPLERKEKVETYPWEVNRGGREVVPSSQITAPSFLVGAWILDRQIAIDLNDAVSARDLSRRIYLALKDVGMDEESAPFQGEAATELTAPAQRKAFLAELRKAARNREKSLERDNTLLDRDYLALGKWAEAARIAAATRNARFFESRDNRRLPSYFLKNHDEDFDPSSEIRQHLEAAARLLGNNDLDPAGLEELASHLDGLIDKYESLADAGDTDQPEDEP